MLRVVQIDIRVAKMHLNSVVEIWVLGTTGNFGERVVFKGVNAAKPSQTIGVPRHLLAHPIVLRLYMSVLVGKGWLIRISVAIRH